jgi:hypothetical protein
MSLSRKTFSAVTLLLAVTAPAFAQDLPQSLLDCSAIQQDSNRLACFDGEIARHKSASGSVASTQVPPAQVVPPAPVVATTPPQNPKTKEDEFGVSGQLARKRKEAEAKTEAPLAELRAAVLKVKNKAYGERVFELDNGQIWEEIEKKNALSIKAGEQVRITPGAIGSYFLTADSGATTRVRRVH